MNTMRGFARAYLRFVGVEYVALGVIGLLGLLLQSESLFSVAALGAMFLLVAPLHFVEPNGIRAADYVKPVGGSNLTPTEVHSAVLALTLLCIISVLGGVVAIWGGKKIWVLLLVVSITTAVANGVFVKANGANPLITACSILWAVSYWAASTAAFPTRSKSG